MVVLTSATESRIFLMAACAAGVVNEAVASRLLRMYVADGYLLEGYVPINVL